MVASDLHASWPTEVLKGCRRENPASHADKTCGNTGAFVALSVVAAFKASKSLTHYILCLLKLFR